MGGTIPSSVILEAEKLGQALKIQARVVGALILREIRTRFWKNQLGYLWAIGEPCVHLLTWTFVFMFLRGGSLIYGMEPIFFHASGILPFFMFSRVRAFIQDSISGNRALLRFPLVKHIDLVIARFILEAITMIVVSTIVFIALINFGFAPTPTNLLGIILASLSMLALGLGFGSLNTVLTELSPTYEKVLALSSRIIYFTSGIFFMAEALPPEFRKYLAYNPALHGVELFRSAYIGYESSFASHSYILLWALGFLFFGLFLDRIVRKQMTDQ